MTETTDWELEKFNEVFDDEIRVLTRRRLHDKNCSISDLEGTLEALYIFRRE
nr:hypothetical protein [Treponema pedis]